MKTEKDIVLVLSTQIITQLKECNRNSAPIEACGLIFGDVKKAIQNPGYKPTVDFVLPDDSFVLAFWSSLEEDYVKRADRQSLLGKWETFLNYLDSVEIILSEKYGVKIVNEFSIPC